MPIVREGLLAASTRTSKSAPRCIFLLRDLECAMETGVSAVGPSAWKPHTETTCRNDGASKGCRGWGSHGLDLSRGLPWTSSAHTHHDGAQKRKKRQTASVHRPDGDAFESHPLVDSPFMH